MKILYIEDDPTARSYICKGLSEHGHIVDAASSGEEGLDLLSSESYDLLVLDLCLPGIDGFGVLEELRAQGDVTRVMILSALGEVSDRIRGLNLGADDYLSKPFAFGELLARVQAVSRRIAPDVDQPILRIADLELDVIRHSVRRDGERVSLTRKEFALLEYMLRHPGQVVSRTMITENVWGCSFDPYSNVIDVHVGHLRKKIDRPFENKLLHTVTGLGYMLEDRS